MEPATPQTLNKNEMTLKQAPLPQLINFFLQSLRAGKYVHAFQAACECILKDPGNPQHMLRLSTIISEITLNDFDPDVKKVLNYCLQTSNLDHQKFFGLWVDTLERDPIHQPLMNYSISSTYKEFANTIDWRALQKSLQDDYLQNGLKCLIVSNGKLEIILTHLRRWLLTHAWKQDDILKNKHLPFLTALAENCFYSEYAMIFSDEEKQIIHDLEQEITAQKKDFDPLTIAFYSLYKPLFRLPNAQDIEQDLASHKDLKDVIRLQITEPMIERELKKHIPVIGQIEDDVSTKVQSMYEDNPYPRWKHVSLNVEPSRETTGTVLVAGCGTGRSSVQLASKFPGVQITAIDLSKSSIAFGMRKAQELGIDNIDFYQCDILDAEKLGKTFDVVECSGVLHHMSDPVEGWRKLLTCLKPGGRMNIGLYSKIARERITQAQKYAKESGFRSTEDGLRSFRRHVYTELPEGHPGRSMLRQKDFYSLSECRDLVFHVQETCYTLPELQKILDDLNLSFLGFRFPTPRMGREYIKSYPGDPDKTDLANWHKMEQNYPRMFIQLYQFICCRADEKDIPNDFCEAASKLGFLRTSA